MEFELSNTSLYRLPEKAEFTLFVIREELKNRKFVTTLARIGFDPSVCQNDFSAVVLVSCGFPDINDESLSMYNEVLDRCCQNFEAGDDEALKTVALEMYIELQIEKRKLTNGDIAQR